MTRLDENRAKAQLAQKAGVDITAVTNMTIWGNHSATQYPDFYNAKINGKTADQVIGDEKWLKETFIPTVQQRGAAIIKARGLSSAASAANAVVDTVRTLTTDTESGRLAQRRGLFRRQLRRRERIDQLFPHPLSGGKWEIVPGRSDERFQPLEDRRLSRGIEGREIARCRLTWEIRRGAFAEEFSPILAGRRTRRLRSLGSNPARRANGWPRNANPPARQARYPK